MTIRQLYNRVASDMMERGGFQLGLVTDSMFLGYYLESLLDFLDQSRLIKTIACVEQLAATADYQVPDYIADIRQSISAGKTLANSDETDQSSFDSGWIGRIGVPRNWRQDKGPMKQVSIYPAPSSAGNQVTVSGAQRYGVISSVVAGELDIQGNNPGLGTIAQEDGAVALILSGSGLGTISSLVSGISNLMLIGDELPKNYAPALTDPVELLPDTFTIYVGYRILAKIFSMDGECKDELRRRYCQARYDEGIALGQAIVGEVMEETNA